MIQPWTVLLTGAALAASASGSASAQPVELRSPNGVIRFVMSASQRDAAPMYRVERHGEVIIAPSALGLQLRYAPDFGPFDLAGTARVSTDRNYPLIAAKAARLRDHYNEVTITLKERTRGRRIDLIVRAYDDGIAFRYRLAEQPDLAAVSLANERTQFAFAADYDCWGLNLGRTDTPHEGEFDAIKASAARPHFLYDAPFACASQARRTHFILTEADLRDYAGLYYRGLDTGALGVEAQLSPRYDDRRVAVRHDLARGPLITPWRVVMMADRAGDLIGSTLIEALNPPPAFDPRWIKPGKTLWDWWSGPYVWPPNGPGMTTQALRGFIDFAAEAGLPYLIIDDGWSHPLPEVPGRPMNVDILRARAGVDIADLVDYARARGVGLLLWVRWNLLDERMDEALDLYARWGIKGLKIDFMDRDDQEMVGFYHRVLGKAADRRQLVILHGSYHPTGLNRTYPNLMGTEGVLGAEYNKWSMRVTAGHNVMLAYTRQVLGPMDYTPGGFRNVTPAAFRIQGDGPVVQTTRGQALAMYVVYQSSLQTVADHPEVYRRSPDGFDFVKGVPATWDETRFVAGDIGEWVVVARRNGTTWYIGAMTDERGRTIDVPLEFLGAGRFTAELWTDGATPTTLRRERRAGLRAADRLTLQLAPSGGAVAVLTPVR